MCWIHETFHETIPRFSPFPCKLHFHTHSNNGHIRNLLYPLALTSPCTKTYSFQFDIYRAKMCAKVHEQKWSVVGEFAQWLSDFRLTFLNGDQVSYLLSWQCRLVFVSSQLVRIPQSPSPARCPQRATQSPLNSLFSSLRLVCRVVYWCGDYRAIVCLTWIDANTPKHRFGGCSYFLRFCVKIHRYTCSFCNIDSHSHLLYVRF